MTTIKTSALYKVVTPAKKGGLESGSVIFKGVPVTYAKVQDLVENYNKTGKEWQLTAFIDEDTFEKCGAMPINKGFAKVDETKKQKGNRSQFKYSSKTEAYEDFVGMYGVGLHCPEFTKKGKKNILKVLDSKGKPFTDLIGNGSICNIKCFAYRNRDEELVITLETIVVVDLVPYSGGNGDAGGFDEDLGIYIPSDSEFGGDDMSEFEDAPEDDTPPFDTGEEAEDY